MVKIPAAFEVYQLMVYTEIYQPVTFLQNFFSF